MSAAITTAATRVAEDLPVGWRSTNADVRSTGRTGPMDKKMGGPEIGAAGF
jgi:hypothetical protein